MSIALDLNFLASETLDARITASGGANGTRVNSSGVVVAATAPRYDYDPTTLAPKGVLIEEARTNLLTYSRAFTNAAWSAVGGTPVDNDSASPDGNTAACKLIFGSTTYASMFRTVTTTSGAAHVLGVFAKAGTRNKISLEMRGATGSVYDCEFTLTGAGTAAVNPSAVGSPTGGIVAFPNGWYYCWIVKTTTNTTPVVIIGAQNTTNLETAYFWQADLQLGSFPTSPILTTAAAVTRTADDLKMTSTNFSSWFGSAPAEGTFVIEYDLLDTASNSRYIVAAIDDSSNFHRILTYSGGLQGVTTSTATSNSGIIVAAPSLNAPHRTAYAFALNDFALVTDGGTVGTDASGPTSIAASSLYIGAANVGASIGTMVGHIRRLKFDTTRRSNADLQALTVARSGAAAITEGADTVTATGLVKISGTAAITEGGDSASGSGEVGVTLVTPAGRIATPSA